MREVRRIIASFRTWCWCCDEHRNEWLSLKIFIERRGKCFYCRMDALDAKYGPSMMAEMHKNINKNGKYNVPFPSKREIRRILLKIRREVS